MNIRKPSWLTTISTHILDHEIMVKREQALQGHRISYKDSSPSGLLRSREKQRRMLNSILIEAS